jgi:hypothetical protein
MAIARKCHPPQPAVNLLRPVEAGAANGKTTTQNCKEALITEQPYYCCRSEYGGVQVYQAKWLKELDQRRIAALLQCDDWKAGKAWAGGSGEAGSRGAEETEAARGRLWLDDGSCVRLGPAHRNHLWIDDFVSARTHCSRTAHVLN